MAYLYKFSCIILHAHAKSLAVGCCGLQVYVGSHLLGRLDHLAVGDQVGADTERLEHIKARCQHLYCEMSPGDGLFFHCNLLHHSSQNVSEHRRMAYIMAYNRADNNPVYEHTYEHKYMPLDMVGVSSYTKQKLKARH